MTNESVSRVCGRLIFVFICVLFCYTDNSPELCGNKTIYRMKSEIDFIPVSTNDVEERMIVLRQQPVLMDCDVAALYGVKTKEINQAVRNNPNKFPPGYVFLLCDDEKSEVVKIFDRLNNLKYSTVSPTAFTERGLYMLATILKSELARTMVQFQNVQDGGS